MSQFSHIIGVLSSKISSLEVAMNELKNMDSAELRQIKKEEEEIAKMQREMQKAGTTGASQGPGVRGGDTKAAIRSAESQIAQKKKKIVDKETEIRGHKDELRKLVTDEFSGSADLEKKIKADERIKSELELKREDPEGDLKKQEIELRRKRSEEYELKAAATKAKKQAKKAEEKMLAARGGKNLKEVPKAVKKKVEDAKERARLAQAKFEKWVKKVKPTTIRLQARKNRLERAIKAISKQVEDKEDVIEEGKRKLDELETDIPKRKKTEEDAISLLKEEGKQERIKLDQEESKLAKLHQGEDRQKSLTGLSQGTGGSSNMGGSLKDKESRLNTMKTKWNQLKSHGHTMIGKIEIDFNLVKRNFTNLESELTRARSAGSQGGSAVTRQAASSMGQYGDLNSSDRETILRLKTRFHHIEMKKSIAITKFRSLLGSI